MDFNPAAVKAHPRVKEFYAKMHQKNLEADRAAGIRRNPLLVDDE